MEPIPLISNHIGLFICEFSIRGLSLERIYRELRGPPVHTLTQGISVSYLNRFVNVITFMLTQSYPFKY